jgi:hypothetical protein
MKVYVVVEQSKDEADVRLFKDRDEALAYMGRCVVVHPDKVFHMLERELTV